MYKKALKRFTGIFLCLLFVGVMVGTAAAATVDLCTGETTLTMPDPDGPGGPLIAEIVPMWGFGEWNAVASTCDNISVPGPTLEVGGTGDPTPTTLTISLTNTLPDPVSLTIMGQTLTPAGGPVWTTGLDNTVAFTGARAAGNFDARVRSFAHEAAPMVGGVPGTATYTWTNFRPGTYLLQSGTNPAKQVQMGLYAAVKKDFAAGEAYPGVFYDKELILVYSEVDPVINNAVTATPVQYGPGNPIPNSLHRDPKYFLINGMAFEPGGGLDPVNTYNPIEPGDTVLVRFLNAGYETHVPQWLNMYMRLVAEDGNPQPAKLQHGVQLPAGKTVDAIITSTTASILSIHDAAHHLTNNGAPNPGGMLAYLGVGLCEGDLNGDGFVNLLDVGLLKLDFGRTDCNNPGVECAGDLNGDGFVNLLDVGLMKQDFGRLDCP